ncbi:MAG: hypothetical protein ACRDI2_07570, partial [Chloroflexota bacterium]
HDAFTLMDPAFWGRLRFDVTARGPVRAAEAERQRFLAERIFDHDGRFDHWRQSLQVELAAGQQARVVYPVHTMVQVFELHGHGRAHAGARGGTGELGTGRFGDREWPTRQPMAVQRAGAYRFVKDWSPTRKVDTANVDEAGSHPPPLYLEVSPPSPPYRRVADFSDPDVEVVAHGPDFAGLGNTLRPYVEAWAEMLVREFLAWQLPVAPLGEPE